VVIGQYATGYAVKPEPGAVARRQVVEPTPGGQECLSDDVGRIVAIVRTAQYVAEHGTEVGRVYRFESLPPLIAVPGLRVPHNCSFRHLARVRMSASISRWPPCRLAAGQPRQPASRPDQSSTR